MAFGEGVAAVTKYLSISQECRSDMCANAACQNASQQAFLILSDITKRQKALTLRCAAAADGE